MLQKFRSRLVGKCSPVHFFWGSFDLCVTRFLGRPAPARPGADAITREAYSHEVSSAGFWPGGAALEEPVFYSYAAPEPPGFRERMVRPVAARYDTKLSEFLLPYQAVAAAADPEAESMAFFESTYDAAADAARWDRSVLERRGSPDLLISTFPL